ncbi:hypothetical protein C8R45DRAFT_937803 [Mycena sanguinolenta]|nr:hypothetical protein C8R45DRAFT_937803 [Mycena sanguinolenta]
MFIQGKMRALFLCALCHIGFVNGFAHPTEDPTRVARAESAIATPTMAFNSISNMVSCGPAVISWMYTAAILPDPLEMTLSITNQDVDQLPAPSTTSTGTFNPPGSRRAMNRRDVTITQPIAANISPELRLYTWDPVNVTSGWYQLIAALPLLPGFNQQSTVFFVAAGSDTSCLASTSSSSSPLSSSASSKPTSTGDLTFTGGASAAFGVSIASGTSTPSETSPVLAPSSKVNRGTVAGAVIGGFAAVAAGVAAYIYFRYGSCRVRRWAGPNSKARGYPSASRCHGASRGRPHSQTDSTGPFMSSPDDKVYARSKSSDPFSDSAFPFDQQASHLSTPSPALSSGASQAETRHSADGSIAPSQRIPRKPVPQYNLTDPSLASPLPSMPSQQTAIYDSDSSREASIRSGRSSTEVWEAPRLAPRRSFGDGRPVHYLIPDMPLPPRE